MGTYLSQPNTTKHSDSGKYDLRNEPAGRNLPYAVSEMQGWRKTMEDAHITLGNLENNYDVPPGTSLFAVFDGHAGKEVASFCSKHFVEQLVELESFKAGAYREALVECFHRMDEMIRDPRYRQEINEFKHLANKMPVSGNEVKIVTEDEREFSDNKASNGAASASGSSSSGAVIPIISLGSKNSVPQNGNSKINEEVDDEVDMSFDEDTDGDGDGENGNSKTEGATGSGHIKESINSPRSESMNLNFLKSTLKEATKNIPANGTHKEEGEKSEKVPDKPSRPEGAAISDHDSVHKKLQNAEAKGSLSKNEAFELMMQVLKLQRSGNKPAAPTGSGEEDGETPDRLDFDEESTLSTVYDFPTVAGCTAIVILVANHKLYTANAGDSRAVLCRKQDALALSFDHKPNNEKEKSRIEAAGGFVSEVGRVCGNLNLSRSIGDLKYKTNEKIPRSQQIITAEPDVTINELNMDDLFMVVACDGVWDILTNDGIVDFVKNEILNQVKNNKGTRSIDVEKIVERIFERCISEDPLRTQGLGGDNMTCILVFLKPVEEIIEIISKKH